MATLRQRGKSIPEPWFLELPKNKILLAQRASTLTA
jgi:hypothetical protein